KLDSKGIAKANEKVDKLTKSVVGLGSLAGVALSGISAVGFNAASQFETAMGQIQSATGATAAQMIETRSVAEDLYNQNFGESWDDLGSAITSVQQVTHLTGDALKDATQNALLLRDAFGYDITESVRTADTMMKQFNITQDQAYEMMAQGQQKGLNKSGDMLDTFNEYANQFKTLGFGATEMFDTLVAGSENGAFNLDKVGDAVKEFNIRAKDGSKTSIQAFEMLGLNADQMMSTFAAGGPAAKQAFTDIMQMIGDIADPVQQNTVGVALMGSQFEDLEASTISALGYAKKSFDETKSSMDELNKVKFNKPGEAFRMFFRQIQTGIIIPIGQKVLPYLNQFGQWMVNNKAQIQAVGNTIANGVGKAINGLILGAQTLWPHIQKIASNISAVTRAATGWSGFAPVVFGLAAAFATYKTIVTAATIATKIHELWTKRAAIAQGALNVVMSLNPIGIIIGLLVGLGVALVVAYKKSETFRNIVNGVWESVKKTAITLFDAIKKTWDKVMGFLTNIDLAETGKNIIQGLINGIVGMKDAVVGKVKDIASGIKDSITGFLDIHSPSRVMMEVGFFTGKGLADGIEGTESMVKDSSVRLAREAVSTPLESNAYTPESSPARASRSNSNTRHEISVKLDLSGSSGTNSNIDPSLLSMLRAMMGEEFESALRRLNLDGDVSYG
ncbi:phage tail tape measure protein, partial [Paenibacillus sp. Marseille-Q4541]|uniref:phage tail tape measure protein n=1 Tax=Paenibacillus sp. Marseille-Q4541 TaxID=2831522 RepID=UPI001BA6F332